MKHAMTKHASVQVGYIIDVTSAICPFEFKTLMHGNEDYRIKTTATSLMQYTNI